MGRSSRGARGTGTDKAPATFQGSTGTSARQKLGSRRTWAGAASYHQLLTNAFRAQHPYGSPRPSEQRAQEIMLKVYSQFPIPQLIGIPNP